MPVEQGEDYQQDGHADPTLHASASRGMASSYLDVSNAGAICPRQLAVQPASAERQSFDCTAEGMSLPWSGGSWLVLHAITV